MKEKLVYIAPVRTIFPSTCASSLHMIKMCDAYASLGYEVTLIVGASIDSQENILSFYNVNNSFKIKCIPTVKSKLGNITYALKSSLYVKKIRPEKLLGRSVTSLSVLALLGAEVTIDMHGPATDLHFIDQWLFKLANKNNNLNKITLNSNALKNIMRSISYIDDAKLVVAHNGSDQFDDYDFTGFESILKYNKGKINVGYFGSLYAGRGIELIIDLANINNNAVFHIFGGVDKEVDYWKSMCLSDNVFFYGHVSYKETFFYRDKCDALIAPYNPSGVTVSSNNKGDSSAYMNPIKLIEYLSAGKPILTSDIGVLKEILNKESAFFCDYNDIASWNDAVNKLVDADLVIKMGKSSLSKFNEGFTWKSRAEKLL